MRLYQAQGGDTLQSLAKTLLGDRSRWQELAYINGLEHPYWLTPGTVLQIPDDTQPLEILVTKGTAPPPAQPASMPAFGWPAAAAILALLWLMYR